MPTLKTLPDTTTAKHLYENKVIVYVEGGDDVQILERLFPRLAGEKIKFIFPGAEQGAPSAGCTAVINRVKTERPHVPAWGIVDRDIFRHKLCWTRLYEKDDEKFKDDNQYHEDNRLGPYIEPLMYWEIESYLIVPEILEEAQRDIGRKRGQPAGDPQNITNIIIDFCRLLLWISAANSFLHKHGKRGLPAEYGDNLSEGSEMEQLVRQAISPINNSVGKNEFEFHVSSIQAMIDGTSVDLGNILADFLRIVDGKSLLNRVHKKFGFRDDQRLALARKIGERNAMMGRDLADFIDRITRLA